MTSTTGSQSSSSQGKRTSFSAYTGGNTSLFLEKAKVGMRRSTPDSEALASSDDEQEHHVHQLPSMIAQQGSRPPRRSSWLNDVQQGSQRKGSLNGSASGSHPATPAADGGPWVSAGSPIGRVHSGSASFPWGNNIWNSDSQKGPPSRLTEVLPSPSSVGSHGSTSLLGDEPLNGSAIRRDSTSDSAIPFAIPLHPTPKTYRSQSYSVGQLDPESTHVPAKTGPHMYAGRTRAGSSYAGLQHRPSRPSMLGDFSHDNSVLEQLREVDDDDEESSAGSENEARLANTQARTIEQLAMENAILRQAALANQLQSASVSNTAYGSNLAANLPERFSNRTLQQQMSESVLEEVDDHLATTNEQGLSQAFNQYGAIGRRLSEYEANPGSQYSSTGPPENRKLESVKKGHWQSSLGFGGAIELPQSRRHSFADIPVRHASISSTGDAQNGSLVNPRGLTGFGDGLVQQPQGDTASYFSNANPALRNTELYRSSNSPSSIQSNHTMQVQHGRMQHFGHPHMHQGQTLYLVTFKAARAEFYYVQEGTGLQVKAGDLVIVEADRGTDLGTVAHENVDWSEAKELKEKYIREHYTWLMLFARNGQSGPNGGSGTNAPLPVSNRVQGSAIGGMGPQGQSVSQEIPSSEIKPKMIKRLAQSHEIQTLRDKEGNEAKAKRMCQQKVAEHQLNMEILDAEFQMDWKKLTFYYFADSYINFNSLVTDLFKIYKTRIWMSAINPASFVTPTAGLQLPSGIGPGALIVDRDRFSESRQRKENHEYNSPSLSEIPQGNFDPMWGARQDVTANPVIAQNDYGQFYHSQGFPNMLSSSNSNGRNLLQRSQSPFGSHAFSTFGSVRQSPHTTSMNQNPDPRSVYADPLNNWAAFQGLSLGS